MRDYTKESFPILQRLRGIHASKKTENFCPADSFIYILEKLQGEGWELVKSTNLHLLFTHRNFKNIMLGFYPLSQEGHMRYSIPRQINEFSVRHDDVNFDYNEFLKFGTKPLLFEHFI